jgi:hypothetical protein
VNTKTFLLGLPSKILITGILVTVASISWSPFGTSVGVGVIALAWLIALIKGELQSPHNKLLFSALILGFMWSASGLIWSEDLREGIASLNIKLPLLVLPLSVLCIRWDHKKWGSIISKTFVLSVFLSAIAGLLNGYSVIWSGEETLISHWSPFISHIRMGLFLALGWGILLINRNVVTSVIYGVVAAVSVWFTESVTGAGMLAFAALYSFISITLPLYRTRSVIASISIAILGAVAFIFILLPSPTSVPLEDITPWGGNYVHHPEKHLEENGNI